MTRDCSCSNNNQEQKKVEKYFKLLEKNLNAPKDIENYNVLKFPLVSVYKQITKGIKIRTRCQWYEDGEISTKFYLNLEKAGAKVLLKFYKIMVKK